jgi:hypothetical protein
MLGIKKGFIQWQMMEKRELLLSHRELRGYRYREGIMR